MTAGVVNTIDPVVYFGTQARNATGTDSSLLYDGPAGLSPVPYVGLVNFNPDCAVNQLHAEFPAIPANAGISTVKIVFAGQIVTPGLIFEIVEGEWSSSTDGSAFVTKTQLQSKQVLGSVVVPTKGAIEFFLPASFFTVPRKLTIYHQAQRLGTAVPGNSVVVFNHIHAQTTRTATGVTVLAPTNTFGVSTYNTNKASAAQGTGSRGTLAISSTIGLSGGFYYDQTMMRFDTTALAGMTGPATLHMPIGKHRFANLEIEVWAFNWTADDNATAYYRRSMMVAAPAMSFTVPPGQAFVDIPVPSFALGQQIKWVFAIKEQRTQTGGPSVQQADLMTTHARLVYGEETPPPVLRQPHHYSYIFG